ncbi:hypothetical protein E1292_12775 [Nonomuraea deserti]|uniref:Thymidylate kinase-like domain-containing protein n=1 Tax=Nonomuraea deserti TaxID=1848322 RepID=A0A4R4VPG7_9ACTN|nr:hypothetical protein [Nonomuraea deserti]TDD07759.1 hypothetical protein E1292_12775 [Nonomuraea deserti]
MSHTDRSQDWTPVVLDGPRHEFPGRLLAIEGSDGSGKSYFVSWLVSAMSDDIPCTHVLMPGEHMRAYDLWRAWSDESLGFDRSLIDDAGLKLMAVGDRLVRQRAIIEPALRRGHLVICERYALTPLVFNSEAMFSKPLQRLYRPDLGLLFDAPSDLLFDRVLQRTDSPVHPQTRHDKEIEVKRFRELAEKNLYSVVGTSAPNDFEDVRPLLWEMLRPRAGGLSRVLATPVDSAEPPPQADADRIPPVRTGLGSVKNR